MNTKSLFVFFFHLLALFTFAQNASLNHPDADGKKDGKWILYLDRNWKIIEDSSKAVCKRYTYFDHGVNVYPMGPCGGKNYKLEPALPASEGKIALLDGEYKWLDDKGRLSSVHVFKNGEYISCKEYFPSGELSQFFDYTKKCEGQNLGWVVYVYDRKGQLVLTSPTCKDKDGNWPRMR